MSILVKFRLYILVFIGFSYPALASNNYHIEQMGADEAYSTGALLRAQFKNSEARQYLKYAADNGNADAAYVYALDSLGYRHTERINQQAQRYLEKAAEGQSLFALNYIYQFGDWISAAKRDRYQRQYHDQLIELGADDPGRALLLLSGYFYHSDRPLSQYYLDKARLFELPKAEMTYAARLEQGEGEFFFNSDRITAMNQSYLKAAQAGYIPATKKYISLLEEQGKLNRAFEWRQKALEQGDVTSLVTLAKIYSGQSQRYGFIERDLIKAKAYLELYLETAGQDRLLQTYEKVEQDYKDIVDTLSEQEIAQAELIKAELVKQETYFHHDYLWLD
ncbi:hypothetical protein [Vibrio salilacus]|uniref:hypothetical protein n=1 Tax=Vibrio salilacus TaxID=1323749 RepID=UPI000C2B1156|nr:hypothetical protein [Vibrio salilacus]